MGRRTKKQKVNARHPFLISWQKNDAGEAPVNRQFKIKPEPNPKVEIKNKNANLLAKGLELSSIKHDIIKSIIFASLILALELVIYLAWNV